MEKLNNFIERLMWHCYAQTWSLLDVFVIIIIIPHLASTYSWWWIVALIPWVIYSHGQARKYSGE